MAKETDAARQLQQLTGLKPKHFADLIRAVQMVFDPSRVLFGQPIPINWELFGITPGVMENLKDLGERYQFASPHLPIEDIWSHLTPETRSWLIEYHNLVWRLEEICFALDEN